MRPKTYTILERAIEEGVRRGYHQAHKHVENPTEEDLIGKIAVAVMGEINEVFSFSDEDVQ